jgi:hypothetical protein
MHFNELKCKTYRLSFFLNFFFKLNKAKRLDNDDIVFLQYWVTKVCGSFFCAGHADRDRALALKLQQDETNAKKEQDKRFKELQVQKNIFCVNFCIFHSCLLVIHRNVTF